MTGGKTPQQFRVVASIVIDTDMAGTIETSRLVAGLEWEISLLLKGMERENPSVGGRATWPEYPEGWLGAAREVAEGRES